MASRVALILGLALLAGSTARAGGERPEPPHLVDSRILAFGRYTFPRALAVGPDGCLVVAGATGWAQGLPVRRPLQVRWTDNMDVVVMKLDPTGTRVLFATHIGGSHIDNVADCAVGPDGSIFVTGMTHSDDFPTTPGAMQEKPAGPAVIQGRAWLARVDPERGRFLYATFLGEDQPRSIAVGSDGSAFLTGQTTAARAGLGGEMPRDNPAGVGVGYACRVAPDGKSRLYATALDPVVPGHVTGHLRPAAIAVDAAGAAVVTGMSDSPLFPVRRAPLAPGGRYAEVTAFAARIDPDGRVTHRASLGETSFSAGEDVAIDAGGTAWVAGTECAGRFDHRDARPFTGRDDPRRSRIFVQRLDGELRTLSRTVVEGGLHEDFAALAPRPGGMWLLGRSGTPGYGGSDPGARVGPFGWRFVAGLDAAGAAGPPVALPIPADLDAGIASAPDGGCFVRGILVEEPPAGGKRPGGFGNQGFLARLSPDPDAVLGALGGRFVLPPLPDGARAGWGPRSTVVASAEGKAARHPGDGEDAPGPGDAAADGEDPAGGRDGGGPGGRGRGGAEDDDASLQVRRGVLVDRPALGADAFRLDARLRPPGDSPAPLDSFDPATTPLRIRAGDRLYPFVLEIYPSDPGWKERGEVLAWHSPEAAPVRARVRLHRGSGRLEIEVTGFDFPGPQQNPVGVSVEGLAPLGVHESVWTLRGEGVFVHR